jgi:DNA-binding transcriptional ArsR family regulator
MPYSSRVVSDLDSLKAVSHPLRLKLLGLLRSDGPATASQLARRVGESSGSTSYHLRQLERFGFVEDDAEQPSGRERRWRASHDMTTLPDELWNIPGGREHLDVLKRRQVEVMLERLGAWTEPQPGIGHDDYVLHRDGDDLVQVATEIEAVVQGYAGKRGAQKVGVHVLRLPAS